jgi:hypothetical protein
VGERDTPESPDGNLDDRRFLGEMVATPLPQGARAPRRIPPPRPPVDTPPPLQVSIEPGTPRLGTEPSPGSTGLVGPASGEVCESLAAVADSGPLDLEVELASTAVPLRVRSNRPSPSPFVRCLMERACRVKAGPEAASRRLTLPVALKVEAPPPPPPPPPPVPVSRVEARPVKGKEGDPQHSFVASMVSMQAGVCVAGVPPVAGHLRFRLELTSSVGRPDRRFLGSPLLAPPPVPMIMMPPQPMLTVTKVISEGALEPAVASLAACLASRMMSQPVMRADPRTQRATVRIDVQAFLP